MGYLAALAIGAALGWLLKSGRDWFRGYNVDFARGRLAFQQDYIHDATEQRLAEIRGAGL